MPWGAALEIWLGDRRLGDDHGYGTLVEELETDGITTLENGSYRAEARCVK